VGCPIFVTFRLAGSLPKNRVFPPNCFSSGQAFVAIDRLLGQAISGPVFLRRPEIAQVVIDAVRDGEAQFHRYDLHAYVVMPNHVHLLVTPHVNAMHWLGPLKGFTAHQANRVLARHAPFWQDESYDHLVRNGEEFRRTLRYIENNPVKAGLVQSPELFPWSSASRRAEARRQA
jgi:REP element-mobilizing transposase RayT